MNADTFCYVGNSYHFGDHSWYSDGIRQRRAKFIIKSLHYNVEGSFQYAILELKANNIE